MSILEKAKPNLINSDLKFRGSLTPFSKKIQKLVQHHMAHTTWTIEDVHNCHIREKGWKGLGYNYWIARNGDTFVGRGDHIGAHAGINWNSISIGIGYQGNYDGIQIMTSEQIEAGIAINLYLLIKYGLEVKDIVGHRDIASTACPGGNFDMAAIRKGVTNKLNELSGQGKYKYFKDVPDDFWAAGDINKLHEKGIIGGYGDETFRPDKPLSRAEAAVLLSRMMELLHAK